ncbi:class I adenylate-forming enzyme family protein [Ferviditalea candida]|uniref:AMP-binding protein n=1 Tax=Ferviditalea candida TaxID=3108399 RepID=A0ABU5ZQA6_9BACL|nr:AMP-binding protein [Paenibacillaceae bacterium T2]
MDETRFERSITSLLNQALALDPEKEVIYDGTRRINYRELHEESDWIASAMSRLGIGKGDRIGVSLPNWHEFIVLYFAISKLGAILVPFNTRYREDEVEYILSNSGAKIVFFPQDADNLNHADKFIQISRRLDTLQHLITVRFQLDGMESYEDLLKKGKTAPPPAVDIDPKEDLFAILYTSGTTGRPKGVMLTHKNQVYQAIMGVERMLCTPEEVFLMPTPLFHVMGLTLSFRTVAIGARMVLMDKYKPEIALSLIESEKVTYHPGVPTMFILELNHPSFGSYDLSSLRTGEMAAAPCPEEIVRRIRSDMGCNVMVGYGLTETSPTLTQTNFADDDAMRAETVGKAWPGVEIKIADEQRREVATGEVGELACRSIGLMKGYYQMPDKTAEAVDDEGWFYTGDLATKDEKGYIRIVGRKKEMVIRGGYNIYPREVEEIFYTHPKVLEIAVVGLPDTVLGQISCAVIRLKPGETATTEEMRAFIKERIADYKVPDKFVFREQFPVTPSGKIKKVELQHELENELVNELR